jgi:hypothetical protein
MFEWLILLLLVALLLIWILDLPEIIGDALGSLVLAAIVGTVKLTAFLIRKLVTALSSAPRSPFPAKPRQGDKA